MLSPAHPHPVSSPSPARSHSDGGARNETGAGCGGPETRPAPAPAQAPAPAPAPAQAPASGPVLLAATPSLARPPRRAAAALRGPLSGPVAAHRSRSEGSASVSRGFPALALLLTSSAAPRLGGGSRGGATDSSTAAAVTGTQAWPAAACGAASAEDSAARRFPGGRLRGREGCGTAALAGGLGRWRAEPVAGRAELVCGCGRRRRMPWPPVEECEPGWCRRVPAVAGAAARLSPSETRRASPGDAPRGAPLDSAPPVARRGRGATRACPGADPARKACRAKCRCRCFHAARRRRSASRAAQAGAWEDRRGGRLGPWREGAVGEGLPRLLPELGLAAPAPGSAPPCAVAGRWRGLARRMGARKSSNVAGTLVSEFHSGRAGACAAGGGLREARALPMLRLIGAAEDGRRPAGTRLGSVGAMPLGDSSGSGSRGPSPPGAPRRRKFSVCGQGSSAARRCDSCIGGHPRTGVGRPKTRQLETRAGWRASLRALCSVPPKEGCNCWLALRSSSVDIFPAPEICAYMHG